MEIVSKRVGYSPLRPAVVGPKRPFSERVLALSPGREFLVWLRRRQNLLRAWRRAACSVRGLHSGFWTSGGFCPPSQAKKGNC